jgi:ribosomal protein L37AE/L43A
MRCLNAFPGNRVTLDLARHVSAPGARTWYVLSVERSGCALRKELEGQIWPELNDISDPTMPVPKQPSAERANPRCLRCGSLTTAGKDPNGITCWTCNSCGRTALDGNEAAWNYSTYQANEVRLSADGKEICAMIGMDPVQGIAGYGASVHEALRDLADQLVKCGVWIEVTDPDHPFDWSGPPKIIE